MSVRASTELFFGDQTPLRRAPEFGGPAYEVRQQQFDMARAVADTLETNGVLCVEAPTGVGKTFAYLVPAIHLAMEKDVAVLVSTHTINLQEQIVKRDIPMLSKLMGVDIRCELAKGRGNYLCLQRLFNLQNSKQTYLPDTPEAKLLKWGMDTENGDFAEDAAPSLPGGIRSEYGCSFENCTGASCPFRQKCHFVRARARMSKAHVVVTNHALLFSVLSAGVAGDVLPPTACVILDEAHTIPDIAAEQFGVRASTDELKRLMLRIHNDGVDGTADASSAAILAAAEQILTAIPKLVAVIQQYIVDGPDGAFAILRTLDDDFPDCTALAGAVNDLAAEIRDYAENLKGDDDAAERGSQAMALADAVSRIGVALQAVIAREDSQCAYWVEMTGRSGTGVRFNGVPPEPADDLRKFFFGEEHDQPVVLTSATLAVNGSLEHYKHRVGAEVATEMILDSPFDYLNQVKLYIPDMPPPPPAGGDTAGYEAVINDALKFFIAKTDGRALVLFTSHAHLRRSAADLADFFQEGHYTFLMQGDDARPAQLLREFKRAPKAVLFGAETFWTGVDVPGEALSNVIIVRLPFATPSHPLAEKREEILKSKNQSPFICHSLPEAVLKFRQAFGRLIRNHTDHGIVVLLDGRIRTKNYGRLFLNSIPRCGG